MDQYRKRGSPVEVEEVPAGMAYRVNDGGIISYHTKETFALLYEPVVKPVAAVTTPASEYITSPLVPIPITSEKPKAKKAQTGKPGYDYDPYEGETGENFIVSRIIAWIILRATGQIVESQGFCSTVREWHIMWKGIWAGIKSPQLGDIPDCPPLWQDESQYYEGAAMVANVGKILFTGGAATAVGMLYAYGITPETILKIITSLGG